MEFDVDELLPFCDNCHASGLMDNPLYENNTGKGTRIITESVICDRCDGRGVIITDEANTLIKFIKRAKSKNLLEL